MNTGMKELNLDEMEQASGGILGLICVLGVVAAEVAIAVGVGYALKETNTHVKIPSHRL